MFYFKKAKKSADPDVDMDRVHSTRELHFMRDDNSDLCNTCKKKFKNGDVLRIETKGVNNFAVHLECDEEKVVA